MSPRFMMMMMMMTDNTGIFGWGPITRRSFPREAFPHDGAQGYVSARCAKDRRVIVPRPDICYSLRYAVIITDGSRVNIAIMRFCKAVRTIKLKRLKLKLPNLAQG